MSERDAAIAKLTAPGMAFEVVDVTTYRGIEQVFAAAPQTLGDLYRSSVSDHPFVVYREERWSFADVVDEAARLAQWLVNDVGIKPGDRVAFAMRNLPEWIHAFMAATSVGAIAVALNALWGVEEFEHSLRDSQPRVLIVDPERLALLSRCSTGIRSGLRVLVVRGDADTPGALLAERVLAGAGDVTLPSTSVSADDHATIFYTSGSTGLSKGVLSTHRQVITAAIQRELTDSVGEVLRGVDPRDARSRRRAAILAVPLFHVTACHSVFLPAYRTQCTLVAMHKWDPVEAARLIERERINWFIAPPAVTHDLVMHARSSKIDCPSLELIGGGGATRPPEQVRRIAETFDAVPSTGWGMTETNSIGTSISGADYMSHSGSCGRAVTMMSLRVVDEQDRELGPDGIGELQVRGTALFVGYWNRLEATADAFDGEWFRTGDIARIDSEGYVYIVDRLKDLIIRGGENIGCGHVEAALSLHPLVIEAVAYSVPDERLGEEVGATIYSSEPIAIDELREFVRPHLSRFAVPRWLNVSHDPLPRTASGKLSRREIQARALSNLNFAND